jgi:hypothetical protein
MIEYLIRIRAMAAPKAAVNRKLRQDTLREYVTERGSVQYLFDLIEKIEQLDTESSDFSNSLAKLRVALDARIKMIGKYLPDVKSVEITGEGGDMLTVAVMRKRFDGEADAN